MDTILFKYLDIEGATSMLENHNLRFTNVSKPNDPFDCNPNLIEPWATSWQLPSMQAQVQQIREECKGLLICSLSKIYDSIPMWSYYTKSHTGVCIGLDITKIEAQLQKIHFHFHPPSTVEYRDISKKPPYTADLPFSAYDYISSVKAECWKHEQEVRMILFDRFVRGMDKIDHPENYYDPIIANDCFVSIYLGVNTREKDKKEIIQKAHDVNPDIKIYQMKPDYEAFRLIPEEIKIQ